MPDSRRDEPTPVATVRYRVLGSIELYDGPRRIPISGPRQVALLAFLLLHANQGVSTDRLLDALWRADAATAGTKRVHVAVARLRKILTADGAISPLQTLSGGYRLVTGPDEVDATVFAERLVRARRAAHAGDHAAALGLLDETLALWRGPPLSDVAYEDFAQAEILRLEEMRLAAIEARADSCLALARHAPLVGELEPLLAEHPTHERLASQLMLALYRCGRQSEALDVYQRTYAHLSSTLGLEPGPALRRLQQEILEQAPALDLPRDSAAHASAAATEPAAPHADIAALPPLLAAMAQQTFVGRADERRRLDRCWTAAVSAQPSLAVIAGEPGIGKTAMAAQVANDVQRQGGTVLYGACEARSVVPYHPVVMALRDHFRRSRPPWRPGNWLGDVAAMLGLTPESRESVPWPADADSEGERYRLFEGVRLMLELLAQQQPMLLIADDLHWAEPSTLAMLAHLARESDPSRLMLMTIYRDTELADDHALQELWSSARVRPVDHITLTGLRHRELTELIEAQVGGRIDEHVADGWHARTAGHPFFVHQLLRRAGRAAIGGVPSDGLPAGVRDAILRRVGRLRAPARATLSAAAIVGRQFDVTTVAALLDDSIEACLDALEEAIAHGLVVELVEQADRFSFAHALVPEALYERQARSRRIRRHARVAEALERTGAPAAELAHHWFEARHVAGHERAVEHSRRAAREAVRALAYEDAATHLQRALEALPASAAFEPERCELLLDLGGAQARAALPSADATFAAAAESARRRDDVHQLARAALGGHQAEPGVRDGARVTLLAEALRGLGDERSALRVEVLARFAAALHFTDACEQAREASADALALASEIGDPNALIAALHGRRATLMHIADVDERVVVLGRLIERAEQEGHPEFVAHGREWSIYALLELGELVQAQLELERFAEAAVSLRQPRFEHAVVGWRAVFAHLDGHLDEAERLAHAAHGYAGLTVPGSAEALLASQLCFIRRDQDRLPELLPAIESYATNFGDLSWRAGRIVALAAAGERDQARAAFDAAARHAFDDVPDDLWWLSTIALFAEGCALVDDARRAAVLYRLLEPYAERHVQLVFAAHLGCVHRYLGLLAATDGDGSLAVEHLELAWERHRAVGAPTLAYRSACDLARILVRSGRSGGHGRAEVLLERAIAETRSTPLEPLITRLAHEAMRERAPSPR